MLEPKSSWSSGAITSEPFTVHAHRYMAPEVVRRESYNEEAEVYCFALVLYELVVHAVPFVG